MTATLPLAPEPETSIMRQQLVALSEASYPGLWWRQQVGEAWTGKSVKLTKPTRIPAGAVVIYGPRRISFGLPGQSDILGCVEGRFISIEAKTETGAQRQSQVNWETAVRKAGGTYAVCRTVQEALDVLRETVRGT